MAEIDGGSLSFKSILDNDQLNTAIEETLRRVQGFSDAVVGSGASMDETTQRVVASVEKQRESINALEAKVAELNTEISNVQPGEGQEALISQAAAVREQIDKEKAALADMVAELNNMQTVNQSAASSLEKVRSVMTVVASACQMNEGAIASLETELSDLQTKMGAAFMSGNNEEYAAIQQRITAINGEIRVRKSLLNDLRNQSNALEEMAGKMETERQKVVETTEAHVSLRARIRELREQMADLRTNGIDENSAAYKELANELGRLQDVQSDIQQQGSILANDEAQFAGIMSGLQGVVGGFTAAQGAVALFAGENEELQQVMLKVQSLMSITMGLQQVSQTLNKDSAFQLVTMNGLRQWWNNLLAVGTAEQTADNAAVAAGTAAETANTAATTANTAATEANATAQAAARTATAAGTAAKTAQTTANAANTAGQIANATATGTQAAAATAGTAANISLAGAFRMVGAAISSIPVFGWIAAGVAAIVAAVVHFTSKANEAKKAAEEFSKAVIDGCYKPIATVEELSQKYTALGDNMEDKKKFIEQNKQKFDELGVAVNGVTDAENLLIANKDTFVAAQIAKAKALIYTQQAAEKTKELLEAEAKLENAPKTYNTVDGEYTDGYGNKKKGKVLEKNSEWKEAEDKVNEIQSKIEALYEKARQAEQEEFEKLKQGGIEGAQSYAAGTVGAIEQAIVAKQAALKLLTNNEEYKAGVAEIEQLQKQLAQITGKATNSAGSGSGGKSGGNSNKDAFTEKLNKYKAEYQRFLKWVNSGDEILVKSANQEFAGLLKEGATYIDYLKKQRDTILEVDVANRTKEQNKQLRTLNDAIAEETKKTVLETFNAELSEQLTNARTVLEMLNIIEQRRKELSGDGTDLDNAKSEALDEAEKSAKEQQKAETDELLKEYESYMAKRRAIDEQYTKDMALLQARRATAMSDSEKAEIDAAIRNRQNKYVDDSKSSGNADYDAMLAEYGTYEQRKQKIIDEYNKKRRTAEEMGDADMVEQLNKKQAAALASLKFDDLKLDPDYIRAFEDLDFTSTETLQALVDKFEAAKEAMAATTDPADLKEYTDAITKMVDEINSRDLFGTLKRGYSELKTASNELKAAEANLAQVRANGGKGTAAEVTAMNAVNKAKDKYMRKNKEVRKSEKEVEKQIDDLCGQLSDLGEQIGGEAGEIISLIGDIGSFVLSTIDGVKAVAKTGAEAISTVEKASVILAIISAAYQIATKIVSMFAGDDGTAAYEAAQKVYEAYVDTINDVIDAELELMDTMTGKDATQKLEYAISLLEKAQDAARTLGKQYLNAGASSGFLGIGSSASNGVNQRDNISAEAWAEAKAVANAYGIAWSQISEGRMTGLFDLTVEQIQALKKEAPLFYASLAEDTRNYLNDIIEQYEKVDEVILQYNETITGVSWDSLKDDFVSALQEMELSAKDISDNIQDYLRKALITDMFKRLYQDKLEDYYKQFAAALEEDSENGTGLSANEQSALDSMREAIVNGAVAATEQINAQFADLFEDETDTSLTGAVQNITEESASIIAGQMNAIRINQIDTAEILRNQLAALNQIAENTVYNRQLLKLDRIISLLETTTASDARAQGLT